MSVLARYLMRAVLSHTAMVMMVLLSLTGLYLLITQQDEIGIGTYSTLHALMYVGLNLPQQAFDMLPIAALIASLLALGNLARTMELTVIRAAGVSTLRISLWVMTAGAVLMVITWVLGEYIGPPLQEYGRQMKTFQKFHDYSMAGNRAAWAKDGDTIFSVQQQNAGNSYGGVYIFKFDGQHRLLSIGKAGNARIDANNRWTLSDYRESRIDGDRIVASRQPSASLDTHLSAEFLGLAAVDPAAMRIDGLYKYIQHLKRNELDSHTAEVAFWSRIARTLAVAVIVVLAIPFAFGPMRSTGTGTRTVIGVMIGVVFLLIARMMESSGALFDLSPLVVAWTPTALLALVTGIAIARVR